MHLKIAVRQDPLSFLRAAFRIASGSQRRVALRWLFALSGKATYDEMLRLQVLEGVAGKSSGAWSNGSRNFDAARDTLNKYPDIHPAWFERGDQDFVGPILRRLSGLLPDNRGDLQGGPEDILQSLAAGLSPYTFDRLKGGPLFYQMGAHPNVKSYILKGDKPSALSSGPGYKSFQNAANTFWRNYKKQNEITGPTVSDDDPERGQIEDYRERPDVGLVFQRLIEDPHDPLGKKIRERILDAVPDRGNNRYIMERWLQSFVEGDDFDPKVIAEELGIGARGVALVIHRLMGNAASGETQATKLLDVIRDDRRLIKEIELRTLAVGGRLASRQVIQRRRALLEQEIQALLR